MRKCPNSNSTLASALLQTGRKKVPLSKLVREKLDSSQQVREKVHLTQELQ